MHAHARDAQPARAREVMDWAGGKEPHGTRCTQLGGGMKQIAIWILHVLADMTRRDGETETNRARTAAYGASFALCVPITARYTQRGGSSKKLKVLIALSESCGSTDWPLATEQPKQPEPCGPGGGQPVGWVWGGPEPCGPTQDSRQTQEKPKYHPAHARQTRGYSHAQGLGLAVCNRVLLLDLAVGNFAPSFSD